MDLDINLDKIKNVPRFLAERAFWVTLILIGVAIVLGVLLGYKYAYLVKQSQPETPNLTHLNQGRLQSVLNRLVKRGHKFEQISAPSYNLFESD